MDKHTKIVGIWIRVSTEDQVKGESPEHHEHRARCYAESKGWHVAKVYRLDAKSGKSVRDYPEAQEMIEDVRAGRITGLLFTKLARLARNTKELLEFSEIFNECNADLISLHEAIDTSTPAGRLFYTIIGAMAQWEREEISERVAASVPIRASLGKPLGGQATFGYQWKDSKLIPHPNEAPIRRLIYELFAEHQRKKTVARLLNERGYRTRKGAKFSDTTVDRLLRDSTAKGVHIANYTKSTGDGKKWEYKSDEDWIENQVEAIVSEELWEKCNGILERQRAKRAPKTRKPQHLFTGLVYCMCGKKMYVPSNSPKYICYDCRNKIPTEDLEGVFIDTVSQDFFESKERVAQYLEDADEELQKRTQELEHLREEAVKVETEMDRLYQLLMNNEISSQVFMKRNTPLEERAQQIAEAIPTLEAEIDVLKIKNISEQQISLDGERLSKQWPIMEFNERRSLVESMVERISIGESISFDLRYFPSIGFDGSLATQPHGFIAATNWKFAGKVVDPEARETVTSPSSSGWRSTSRTVRLNSGSSSRNRTPLCAKLISPGVGLLCPPSRPASEIV